MAGAHNSLINGKLRGHGMLNIKRLKGAGATLMTVAIVSGVAASALGQRQYVRLTTAEVWAAANPLPTGHTVQSADLKLTRVANASAGLAVTDPRAIVGRQLVAEKKPGDIISEGDVATPQRLGMTDVIPADRVVYTLVPDRQLLPYTRQLRNGDNFDILATAPGGRVSTLAYDVILLGNLIGQSPAPNEDNGASLMATITAATPPSGNSTGGLLVLAVKPEHVYPLASALGSNARISLVAHGRSNNSDGSRLAVQPPPARERRVEIINGLQRAYINVRQDTAP